MQPNTSRFVALCLATSGLATLAACKNEPSVDELREMSRNAAEVPRQILETSHKGPAIAAGSTGTARFARQVYDAFDAGRAMETAVFVDGFYREPGNEGFEAVLDRVKAELEKAGFGAETGLQLEVIETPMSNPAWTPRRARVALRVEGSPDVVLHEFSQPADRDRTMLPHRAPSGKVEGPVVFRIEDVTPGSILATEESLGRSVKRAKDAGAVAVLSSRLAKYNVDASGAERHLDAVLYTSVSPSCPLPVAQISPRSFAKLKEAPAGARVSLEAEVELADRPLRTLVATIVGAKRPNEAVVIAAHVQEPGACDNASGVATLLEGARTLADLTRSATLERPARSLVFLWGNEIEQSRIWLANTKLAPIAAIAADMTGESAEKTGAVALLERPPDPGAVLPLPPDEHTAWGATAVDAANLKPCALPVIARCALADVSARVAGWPNAEHPYEGGSDHTVFVDHGIPAVLFWHFTDFAYHTSLDRIEHVDPDEMHRVGAAILATALAVADPRPADLDRYLESLKIELDLRVAACRAAKNEELAESWREWIKGARMNLREMCLTSAPPAKN